MRIAIRRLLILLLLAALPVMAQSHSATLTWSESQNGDTFNVYRSIMATGPFTIISSPATTTYTDTSVLAGSDYWYYVTAVNAGVESAPTATVETMIPGTVTPPPPPPTGTSVYLRYGTTASYTDPSGNIWTAGTCAGTNANTAHAITGTTTQPLYQTECYGKTFTLTISGLIASAPYTLTGKFAEDYWTGTGKRIFSVTANGSAWLTAFDIFKDSGGEYIADDKSIAVTATATGTVVLVFTTTTDNAKIDALSLVPSGAAPPPPPKPTAAITCSGLICTTTLTNVPSGTTGTASVSIDGVSASTTITAP